MAIDDHYPSVILQFATADPMAIDQAFWGRVSSWLAGDWLMTVPVWTTSTCATVVFFVDWRRPPRQPRELLTLLRSQLPGGVTVAAPRRLSRPQVRADSPAVVLRAFSRHADQGNPAQRDMLRLIYGALHERLGEPDQAVLGDLTSISIRDGSAGIALVEATMASPGMACWLGWPEVRGGVAFGPIGQHLDGLSLVLGGSVLGEEPDLDDTVERIARDLCAHEEFSHLHIAQEAQAFHLTGQMPPPAPGAPHEHGPGAPLRRPDGAVVPPDAFYCQIWERGGVDDPPGTAFMQCDAAHLRYAVFGTPVDWIASPSTRPPGRDVRAVARQQLASVLSPTAWRS
ncbi:MAG: hypothetical protein U0P45_01225 [Acidimicrobiales bacterium]